MSTQPPAAPTPSPQVPGTQQQEIRIISHSTLFYWWPVWAVGFLMALLTLIDGHVMAIVPAHTKAYRSMAVEGSGVTVKDRDILVVPQDAHLLPNKPEKPGDLLGAPEDPHVGIAASHSYGVMFAIVLLLVTVITNVPLRGLWSVFIIAVSLLLTIIFWQAGWWESIFRFFEWLSINMNFGGYVFISSGLFAVWLLTFLFFDQQIYMVFTPGQLRVRTEIGGGETAYDTAGMTVQKQRSDLFRHWVLGLGSGDLIVNTSGAQAQHFDLPNVLFIGRKVKKIEDMLREKPVVRGH